MLVSILESGMTLAYYANAMNENRGHRLVIWNFPEVIVDLLKNAIRIVESVSPWRKDLVFRHANNR